MELIGEHRSPFRDPPLVRARFDKKSTLPLREGLAPIQIFGEYQCRRQLIFPGLPGHRPALQAGLRVSGVRSPNRRKSPAEGFSLFAIRVNVPDLCLVSCAPCAHCALLRDFGEQSRPRSYFGEL